MFNPDVSETTLEDITCIKLACNSCSLIILIICFYYDIKSAILYALLAQYLNKSILKRIVIVKKVSEYDKVMPQSRVNHNFCNHLTAEEK